MRAHWELTAPTAVHRRDHWTHCQGESALDPPAHRNRRAVAPRRSPRRRRPRPGARKTVPLRERQQAQQHHAAESARARPPSTAGPCYLRDLAAVAAAPNATEPPAGVAAWTRSRRASRLRRRTIFMARAATTAAVAGPAGGVPWACRPRAQMAFVPRPTTRKCPPGSSTSSRTGACCCAGLRLRTCVFIRIVS